MNVIKKQWLSRGAFFLLLPLLLLITAASGPKPSDTQKVMMISFDGGSHELLHQFISDFPSHTGFSRILTEGVLARQGMQVALPSLTATSHASLITGAPPSQHGIVSNKFHRISDPIHRSTNGFDAALGENTPALWETARAAGKRVGVISYPGLDNTNQRRSADWSVNFSKSLTSAARQTFERSDFRNYPRALPPDYQSYSAPQSALINLSSTNDEAPHRQEFRLIAIDTTPDRQTNYDTFIFDRDSDLQNGYLGIATQESPWAPLSYRASGKLRGSWCKIISATPTLSTVDLYIGPQYQTTATPSAFQRRIDDEIGFWPGPPEKRALGNELTEEDLLIQAIRLSDYLKEVTRLGAQTQSWDLIITYQPILDELEHQFYMIDPQQKDYSRERSRRYMDLIRRGYLQANRVVHEWMESFPNTNVVIVSDHGMAPLHHVYYPNRVLAERGYIEGNALAEQPRTYQALAFSSGGLSHVYLNVEGRNPQGVVSPHRFEQIRQELLTLFQNESAIAQVYTPEEAASVGLNHSNSGDLILVANPGYHLSDDLSRGASIEQATFYGQHGYDPSLSAMKALYAAWGPQVEREPVESISYQDVRPFILRLLGL